jgi:excinuclease ABC subunit C
MPFFVHSMGPGYGYLFLYMPAEFNIDDFLASLTSRPGVYIYRDESDKVLYVGKAKNLKNRVSSYFRKTALPARTMLMVSRITHAEVHQTHTEVEALLLENNLIKQHRPYYNVLLKDDKSYPYIRLNQRTRAPWLSYYRGARNKKGRFFGPFPSALSVRETLSFLEQIFKLRQCTETIFKHRSRPCLQYQIKRCSAPCVGRISDEDYAEDVKQAIAFLEGHDESLAKDLVRKMDAASKAMEYEQAAELRDRIAALKQVQARQYVSSDSGDADIIALKMDGDKACFYVSYVRHGRHLGGRHFIEINRLDVTDKALMQSFITQYYLGETAPNEIILSLEPREIALIETALCEQSPKKIQLKTRVRGHRLRWLKYAMINADDCLRQHQSQRSTLNAQYAALMKVLGLKQVPNRMECFDISHTGGERTVASCVVFDENGPVKSAYRRFNIDGIEPGDDYAAMRQVLMRRYQRLIDEEAMLPDLIVIDGGKGQMTQALEVMAELQRTDVPLLGVSKGPERRPGEEKLHLAYAQKIMSLAHSSPALHLIQQIRDEAHRFAITGHRARRAKKMTESPLQGIEGIGDKRRQALLKSFGGLQAVKNAGVEDLAKTPGISPKLAQRIYELFH